VLSCRAKSSTQLTAGDLDLENKDLGFKRFILEAVLINQEIDSIKALFKSLTNQILA
jgi:hypothetical protein